MCVYSIGVFGHIGHIEFFVVISIGFAMFKILTFFRLDIWTYEAHELQSAQISD